MTGLIRQAPGFLSGRSWKKIIAAVGYVGMVRLIAGGLFGLKTATFKYSTPTPSLGTIGAPTLNGSQVPGSF